MSAVLGYVHMLGRFGFKTGVSGAHSARTMMLAELSTLLSKSKPDATHAQLVSDIVDYNALDKPTTKARQLTARHLTDLYALDPKVPIYRVFRLLWDAEPEGRPILALLLALARDPILQKSKRFILNLPIGKMITREDTEQELRRIYGDRLSASSIRSYAQNINGTWTQAGYLKGRIKKVRQRAQVTPTSLVFALFLAYLEGATGERLFSSSWAKLLDQSDDRLHELAQVASHRGLLIYRRSGGVTEVRFPDYLTPEEFEELPHEQG